MTLNRHGNRSLKRITQHSYELLKEVVKHGQIRKCNMLLLYKYLLKGKDIRKANYHAKPDKKAEKVWFCWEYQRYKCSHKSSHLKVVKGDQRLALHICSSCWLKDKKKKKIMRKVQPHAHILSLDIGLGKKTLKPFQLIIIRISYLIYFYCEKKSLIRNALRIMQHVFVNIPINVMFANLLKKNQNTVEYF